MKQKLLAMLIAVSTVFATDTAAQTASSLFLRSDSLQVKEIVSEQAERYDDIGHHGPAVENSHFAVRLYFNDSGAIDVYSKSGRQMELRKYLWHPDPRQQQEEGAGCDEYMVGKTVGLGGIALWDGEKVIRLKAAEGRTARVGETKSGSFAELIAYGVKYKGDSVDILMRVEMSNDSRVAKVTARSLNGRKVQFVTGVNFHEGNDVEYGRDYIAVWGTHPADVSQNPTPLGSGMWFSPGKFIDVEKLEDSVRLISKPCVKLETVIISSSSKEEELNTKVKLFDYIRSN